ncbi:hypothetical protein GCM10009430_40790 [Aquimarina litoralis]|uniref:HYR domain-containing protein n=1 Tax=Aquimarina litoralis TaxID=584605 RepID=A0ABP3UGZ0_9FLAO
MQKKYLLIILLFLVGITISHAQYTSIPDANFEAALVALGHDSVSGDGQVLTADIATITELDIRNEQITDLTGIEDFSALEELRANFNSISSVDLSQNTALETLFIGDNDLTALDVSANINLDYLSISDLNLTAGIDISQNTKLTNFVAENSNLSTIDVSNNVLLQQLELEDNNLTALDVTNLTALESLIVSDNQLTTIDLSNNTQLEFFGFQSNNFGSLDFSGLSNLTIIDGSANNNLTTVNLTGVTALEAFQVNTASITSLDFSDATNLNFLSVIGSQLENLDLRNNTALTVIQIPNNNLTSLDLRNIDVTQINLSAFGNNDLDCISVDDVALAEANLSSDFRYSIDCALYTYVPDDNFEAALAVYDDTPGDNSVPKAAIEIITTLDVSSLDIADLTGIQDFIALTSLNASTNNLKKVDLSNNTNLQIVNLEENSLKTLDVSNLVNLTSLEVDKNDLFALNIKNGANTNLTFFDATENADLNCILVDSETYANANFANIDNQTSFSETDCTIYVAIPDSNFEVALAAYDDISSDGQIPLENIYDVEELDVQGNTISDLTGIASFESLTTLNCSENSLTTIDLSSNALLESLTCGNNNFSSLDLSNNNQLISVDADDCALLTSINLSGCTVLETLEADDNNLSTIDLSTNINLRSLDLDNNIITSLDLSNNTLLEFLDLDNNNLSALDLSNNSLLEFLDIETNNISTLDLTVLPNLERADLESNPLTAIDFSQNLLLEDVDTDDTQIVNLDFSNNTALTRLDIDNTATLTTVVFGNAIGLTQLYIDETAIESIDVSPLTGLRVLDVGDTNLKTLDISANIALTDLRVDNADLVSLDLRNGNNSNFSRMEATSNTSLTCIMVDDATAAVTDFTDIDMGVTFSETTCGYTLIPDANFEAALSVYDDIASDGLIPTDRIENVSIVNVANSGISDLTGIEAFVNLETLNVNSNNLSVIDLSNNSNLEILNAFDNELTSIDLSRNTQVERVYLGENQLSTIDVSTNTILEVLDIHDNGIAILDLSLNVNLEELNANNNGISSIDLSNNTLLEEVSLDGNDITTINISGLTNLEFLYLEDNNLSSIDVTTNSSLGELLLNDNTALSSLDLTNNGDIRLVYCNNCSDLSSITFGNSTDLETIQLDNTALTNIDLSLLVDLREISLRETDITFLDLSNNPILLDIYATDGKLTGINLKNGGNTGIDELEITGNPDLYCVEVDDVDYANTNFIDKDVQTSFSLDCIAPVITLNGANPQTIELGAGYTELGVTTDDGTAVSIDTSEFMDAVGSYTIYYDATDAAGNVAIQVTRTVDVVDTTAPVITLNGANPQTIELGAGYTELGATTDDGSAVSIDTSEFMDAVGSYTIYYDATDAAGNVAIQVTRTVDVVDTTAPVITLNGANPQTIELGAGYTELGATTDDGSAVSINTSEFMDAVGSYTIYYDATDAAGNTSIQVTRTVDVVDTTAPVITLNGANPQIIELGAGYTELGATTDDGSAVSIDTLEFMDAVGSYTIYYDATDAAGNTAIQVTRTVNVVDTTNPTVVCQNITVQLDDTGNASITAAMIDNGSTDLSGIASIVIDVTDFDCTNIGDNMVTLTVTDTSGNTDMCMATVTVEDEVAPEFDMTTVPTDMEVPFDSGNMYTLADFTVGVVVTDNCDTNKSAFATTIRQSPVAGTLLAEGDHVITLSAIDDNLNIETVSFTITVSGVLSVEENTEDIFSIYPNPAMDQFWITGVSGEAAVTFYDINGRMLQTIKVMNDQAISTRDLSEGVYLITIEQNDVNQTIRLIKK